MNKTLQTVSIFFIAEIIIGRFLSGIVPIFIKLTSANTYEIGLFRLAIAAFIVFIFLVAQKKSLKYTKTNIGYCLAMGLSFGLHWLFYFLSIKISTVTIATIGVASYGIFLMVIGNIFFYEKITKREICALIIAIVGSLIIIPKYDFSNSITIGFLLGLLNAFLFAITAAVQKHAAKHVNFETRIFSQYAFALLVFLPFSFETQWQLQNSDWIYLIILAIFCTLIAHTLWIRAVEKLSLKTAGVIYYLSTFFGIATGILILKDPISYKTVLGGSMIIISSIMATMKKHPPKSELKSIES